MHYRLLLLHTTCSNAATPVGPKILKITLKATMVHLSL